MTATANAPIRIFRVRRYDPDQDRSWWQEFEVPTPRGMTVLEGLWHILRFTDGSLSFCFSCRGAVCGSCAMLINQVITLACHTQISSLADGPVIIEPLPRMRVLKDLVVDMELFLKRYTDVEPWFAHEQHPEKETLQSPSGRQRIKEAVTCLLCASCQSACPLTGLDADYDGPAVITAMHRYANDSRYDKSDEMIARADSEERALGCRRISRCTEVCPRDIAPSDRIHELKQNIRRQRLEEE